MSWELIAGLLIGALGFSHFMSGRFRKLSKASRDRDLVLKAELERTERELREKSLPDNIDRLNELLNKRENKS